MSLSSYCIIPLSRRIFVAQHYFLSSQNLIASIRYFISSIASLKFIPISWFNHHVSVIPSAPSVSSQTESINLYHANLLSLTLIPTERGRGNLVRTFSYHQTATTMKEMALYDFLTFPKMAQGS